MGRQEFLVHTVSYYIYFFSHFSSFSVSMLLDGAAPVYFSWTFCSCYCCFLNAIANPYCWHVSIHSLWNFHLRFFSLWFAFTLIIWKIERAIYLPFRKFHYSDLRLPGCIIRYLMQGEKHTVSATHPLAFMIKHLPLIRPPAKVRDPVKSPPP